MNLASLYSHAFWNRDIELKSSFCWSPNSLITTTFPASYCAGSYPISKSSLWGSGLSSVHPEVHQFHLAVVNSDLCVLQIVYRSIVARICLDSFSRGPWESSTSAPCWPISNMYGTKTFSVVTAIASNSLPVPLSRFATLTNSLPQMSHIELAYFRRRAEFCRDYAGEFFWTLTGLHKYWSS